MNTIIIVFTVLAAVIVCLCAGAVIEALILDRKSKRKPDFPCAHCVYLSDRTYGMYQACTLVIDDFSGVPELCHWARGTRDCRRFAEKKTTELEDCTKLH